MNSWPRWPDWRACLRPLWPLGGPRPLYPVDRAHCWSSSCAQRAHCRKTANWKYCYCPRSVTSSGGFQTKINHCKVCTAINTSTLIIWNHVMTHIFLKNWFLNLTLKFINFRSSTLNLFLIFSLKMKSLWHYYSTILSFTCISY